MTTHNEPPKRPETLYKYLPPERIDVFENLELRFSRPGEFNDAFDTHYLVPKSQGTKGTAARLKLLHRVGVLCLTTNATNHLMWVNYARNLRGFVVGFDASSPFFTDDGRTLGIVRYRPRPAVLQDPDLNACFYKSTVWSHEDEWRCVRKFERSESRDVAFPPEMVTEIIFGARMEAWQIARVLLCVQKGYALPHVRFMVSALSKKDWAIENVLKTLNVCDRCGGDGYVVQTASGVTK